MRFCLLSLCLFTLACASSKRAHFDRGIEAYDSGRFDDAAREFRLAVREGDRSAIAQFNQGLSYFQAGQYLKAVETYQASIDRFGDSAELRINLGAALAALSRVDEAGQAFEQAIRLDETYAYPYLAYTRFLLDQDRGKANLDKAHALMIEALALEPQSTNVHYFHGLVLDRLDQRDEACEAFSEAASLNGSNEDAALAHGQCLLDSGQVDGALQRFMRAGVAMPDDPRPFMGAAVCYRERGDYERALQAFRRAESLGANGQRVQREIALTSVRMLTGQIDRLLSTENMLSGAEREMVEEKLTHLKKLRDEWARQLGR